MARKRNKARKKRNLPHRIYNTVVQKWEHCDYSLVIAVVLLISFGLIMLYSMSYYTAIAEADLNIEIGTEEGQIEDAADVGGVLEEKIDPKSYFSGQLENTIIGLICMVAVSFVSRKFYGGISLVVYGISMVLLLFVELFGVELNSAKRWLSVGGRLFQPNEISKIAIILLVSWILVLRANGPRKMQNHQIKRFSIWIRKIRDKQRNTKIKYKIRYVWYVLLKLLYRFLCFILDRYLVSIIIISGVTSIAVWQWTDNLSTALIVAGIGIGIFLVGAGIGWIPAAVFFGGFIYWWFWNFSSHFFSEGEGGFRIDRVLVWLDPEQYASDGGYQTLQALYAIGSGGWFGKGLGNGTQKLDVIPEVQNDMILAAIAEELGIIGIVVVLLLYGMLLFRIFQIARHAPDLYGGLVASGVFIHLSLQVILNIAVITNLIPNTGVTLPFFSYGGTSVIILLSEIGLVWGISNSIPVKEVKGNADTFQSHANHSAD